jgi:hypothetical protein
MPTQLPAAMLNILNVSQPTPYKQATNPAGQQIPYWYLFTGGADGHGSMYVSLGSNGNSQMAVDSQAGSVYTMQSVEIMQNGQPLPQGDPRFSTAIATNGFSCTITDWITRQPGEPTQTYYYQITLKDTQTSQLIVVDPTIQNRPLR